MPIFEFYCPDNHRIYAFLARTLSVASKTPRCPDNPGFRMERLISKVSILRNRPEPAPGGGDEPADPRMEAAMAAMEAEFTGMDENNPDPKAMGKMMRRMAELTGQKMPAEFEEMTRRLEAGEDPERLEEEYGDAFDSLDEPGEPVGTEGPSAPEASGKTLRKLLPPSRDPLLHEMRDFVD